MRQLIEANNFPQTTISCKDNLKFMRALPDECMDLIITSPPYNIGKQYENKATLEEYINHQEKVILECIRLLDSRGSLCWQVGNYVNKGEVFPLDMLLYPIFKKHGLKLRNRIIWHFEHGLHCTKRLSGRYETIMWFTKSDDYYFNCDDIRVPSKYPNKRYYKGPKKGELSGNPLGKNPSDVWIFPNVKNNHPEKTDHPCQFPVELVERLVLSMTKKGGSVFDPYMGVGSSIIAAIKHSRYGFGCDVVKKYVDIAWRRVASWEKGVLQTRPMDRPVYDPSKKNGGQR